MVDGLSEGAGCLESVLYSPGIFEVAGCCGGGAEGDCLFSACCGSRSGAVMSAMVERNTIVTTGSASAGQ